MFTIYRCLNWLFHFLHLSLVFFLVVGWIFPLTRVYHLALIAVVLGSWIVFGYCPLTEWHWKIRNAAKLPPASGPYIPFLVAQISKRGVNAGKIDKMVIATTGAIAVLSIYVNSIGFFGR